MNHSELQDAVYNWVSPQIAPALAMFSDQDASQADRPYATIKVLSKRRLGDMDEQGAPNGLGIATVRGHREAAVSVKIFGPGALQMATKLQDSLNTWTVLQALKVDGLAFVNDAGIIDLSEKLETEIEERAVFDLTFRYATEQTDDVGIIETVEVENLIDENNGNPGNGTIIELDSL